MVKLFSKNSNLCDHEYRNVTDKQTDGQLAVAILQSRPPSRRKFAISAEILLAAENPR